MPGIGGFGGAAVTIGTETNDDVPNVIITPSGDVLTEGGNLIHGEGGGRGQGGNSRIIVVEEVPLIEKVEKENYNWVIALLLFKFLGVF
jgi:hypothetical protein